LIYIAEKRKAEALRIREKYSDRVPVFLLSSYVTAIDFVLFPSFPDIAHIGIYPI